MNTYDFDKTIYIRDSSVDFILYCLKKYPTAVLPILPRLAVRGLRCALKRCEIQELKEAAFSYLKRIPDAEAEAKSFWAEKKNGIGAWYLRQRKDDDIIISASPEFLLRPVAELLNVEIIATRMDSTSGKILGKNCHDCEKVRRFYEKHPDAHTEEFYSDSLSDASMAHIAKRAFLVKRGKLSPWGGLTSRKAHG